jgi:hypothetical protein
MKILKRIALPPLCVGPEPQAPQIDAVVNNGGEAPCGGGDASAVRITKSTPRVNDDSRSSPPVVSIVRARRSPEDAVFGGTKIPFDRRHRSTLG